MDGGFFNRVTQSSNTSCERPPNHLDVKNNIIETFSRPIIDAVTFMNQCIECTGAFVWTRSNHGSFVGSEFKSELLYVLQLVVIRIFPNHWKLYDKPSK